VAVNLFSMLNTEIYDGVRPTKIVAASRRSWIRLYRIWATVQSYITRQTGIAWQMPVSGYRANGSFSNDIVRERFFSNVFWAHQKAELKAFALGETCKTSRLSNKLVAGKEKHKCERSSREMQNVHSRYPVNLEEYSWCSVGYSVASQRLWHL
jgi:hypothetical protein